MLPEEDPQELQTILGTSKYPFFQYLVTIGQEVNILLSLPVCQ